MQITFVKNLPDWTGDANLYKLEPPIDDMTHIVVSAVMALDTGQAETLIFAANEATAETQEPTSWTDLDGSLKGTLDHEEAIAAFREEHSQHRKVMK
jgi:hypothetical protein